MKPTSKNAKGLTCWKRFGVLVLFAPSGMNNVVSARCAIQKSPGSQAGAFITASHVRWVVRQLLATAFYFIPSAMTGFIVSVFPFRNRVSSKEAFEGLELGERKLSRPVLRGPGGRKVARLLGNQRPENENGRSQLGQPEPPRVDVLSFYANSAKLLLFACSCASSDSASLPLR